MRNTNKKKMSKNAKKAVAITSSLALLFSVIACENGSSSNNDDLLLWWMLQEQQKQQQQPIAQSKTISNVTTSGGSVDVVVNYTAKPGVPAYMADLEAAVRAVLSFSSTTSNLTINIVSDGVDGFVVDGSKTVKVRESWLANATETEMGVSLNSKLSLWVAMVKSNVYLAKIFAEKVIAQIPQTRVAIQQRILLDKAMGLSA